MPDNTDAIRLGRSKLARFRPGEDAGSRHGRRVRIARKARQEVSQWCKKNGVALEVREKSHLWQFTVGNQVALWFPWPAQLIVGEKEYKAYDFKQVIEAIESNWNLPGQNF